MEYNIKIKEFKNKLLGFDIIDQDVCKSLTKKIYDLYSMRTIYLLLLFFAVNFFTSNTQAKELYCLKDTGFIYPEFKSENCLKNEIELSKTEYLFIKDIDREKRAEELIDVRKKQSKAIDLKVNEAKSKNNQIIKTIFKNTHPPAIQAFILNLRKEKFQDINLRKAINLAFDFKWLNQHIFYNSYKKTYSYFENSTFSAKLSNKELFAELEENEKINNGNGFNRNRLLLAQDILKKAGYKIINKKLFAPNNQNNPISIEFLIDSPAFEMVIAPFVNNLKKLGIQTKVRFTEQNQYQNRVKNFNFDIIISVFGQASIPGEELFFYWHSSQKDIIGSRNLSGVSNAKIDKIIENINQTNDIKIITKLARELDKELISNYYCILQWHNDSQRILYRNIFSIPKISPEYGINLDSWSIK